MAAKLQAAINTIRENMDGQIGGTMSAVHEELRELIRSDAPDVEVMHRIHRLEALLLRFYTMLESRSRVYDEMARQAKREAAMQELQARVMKRARKRRRKGHSSSSTEIDKLTLLEVKALIKQSPVILLRRRNFLRLYAQPRLGAPSPVVRLSIGSLTDA